jgi:oxalate decarboxylase family bicupin protein
VKIVDPLTFPIASTFSAALVTVKPGGMREIHWHPSSDEWSFFIAGKARATLFSAPSSATTFDYRPGDVGYFPQSNSHYIENTGDTDLIFLEVLQADHFSGKFPCSSVSYIFFVVKSDIAARYLPWAMGRLDVEADHQGQSQSQR